MPNDSHHQSMLLAVGGKKVDTVFKIIASTVNINLIRSNKIEVRQSKDTE